MTNERMFISSKIVEDLNDIGAFLTAFESAYSEVGADYIEGRDATAIEKIIDDVPIAVSVLRRVAFEYERDVATHVGEKIGQLLQTLVERMDGGLSMICVGSGAEQFRRLLRAFLSKEAETLTNKVSVIVQKFLKPRYGTDYLAMTRVRAIVSTSTMALRNNPKSGLARRLADEGFIEYRRDRHPDDPAVDTGWEKKNKVLNTLLLNLYNAKVAKKEER